MLTHPGHSFTKIPILHETALLERLPELVTIEPTIVVMETATGIPPYIEMAVQMKELMDQMSSLALIQRDQTATLVAAIEHAIDKKAYDSGNITGL